MDIVVGVIVGLIILTVIVVLHELGHAMMARKSGVVVQEFGIGFPPKAWGKKLKKSFLGKNVLYSVNWLPLGGFVRMQGEHDADTGKGDYGAATFWQKTKILLAGVAMNWLTAIVLLSALALFGIPRVLSDQFTVANDTHVTKGSVMVGYLQSDSPAVKAGLKQGDALRSFAGVEPTSTAQVIELAKQHKGETVEMIYERDGKQTTTQTTLRDDGAAQKGYLGAQLGQTEMLRATWSAPIVGVGLTYQLTVETFKGLGTTLAQFVSGVVNKLNPDEAARKQAAKDLTSAGNNVAGPVGLLGKILPGIIQAGVPFVVLIMAIISVSLAALNVLPIPALDGGRWFVMAVYRLFGKVPSAKVEERIHGTGFMLLMGLFVLITIADIGKF